MTRIKSLPSLALGLAVGAAAVVTLPGVAQAQFWGYGSWYGPRPGMWAPDDGRSYEPGRLRPGQIVDVLRRYGWVLLGPPQPRGGRYTAMVRDGYGRQLFVVLSAYDGSILRTRPMDERPDTSELAAIPDRAPPAARPIERDYRPPAPRAEPPVAEEPAVKPRHRRPAPVARRELPPPAVKAAPTPAPEKKKDDVAVSRPTSPPPVVAPAVVPPTTRAAPPAAETPAVKAAPTKPVEPAPAETPTVRQVYPSSGVPAAPPAPADAPSSDAPKAASAEPTPKASSPPPVVPKETQEAKKPDPKRPGPKKSNLPADVGYE